MNKPNSEELMRILELYLKQTRGISTLEEADELALLREKFNFNHWLEDDSSTS